MILRVHLTLASRDDLTLIARGSNEINVSTYLSLSAIYSNRIRWRRFFGQHQGGDDSDES